MQAALPSHRACCCCYPADSRRSNVPPACLGQHLLQLVPCRPRNRVSQMLASQMRQDCRLDCLHALFPKPAAAALQAQDRDTVEQQAQLLAFDRQNHAGASDRLANSLRDAIAAEAEAMLQEKRVVTGAVNIGQNRDKMKVGGFARERAGQAACSSLISPDGPCVCL